MVKYFIAKTIKGREFVFSKARMIAVPTNTAWEIAEQLTELRYDLKEGEIWYVYDNDWYYNDYIIEQIKSYSPNRNIKLYKYVH